MKNSPALLLCLTVIVIVTTQCSHPDSKQKQPIDFVVTTSPSPSTEPTPSTAASPPSALPQVIVTTKQLEQLANGMEIKATMKDRTNGPQFFIQPDTFVFYQGSLPTLGDEFIQSKQYPILIPLARKLQLDDLRRFLSEKTDADVGYWDKSFELADSIIEQKSLALIASGTLSGEELTTKLYEYDGEIDRLFVTAAQDFAKARNLTYKRGITLAYIAHKVEVSFVKNPSEGHLFVIPSTLYAPDGSLDYMWREILADKTTLGGTYYYKVTWPNGGVTSPTRFSVEQDAQVITINQ